MKSDEFWVKADDMDHSSQGFSAMSTDRRHHVDRIAELLDPGLAAMVGSDAAGQEIWKALQRGGLGASTVADGLSRALSSTGEALRDSARLFREAEDRNGKLVAGLGMSAERHGADRSEISGGPDLRYQPGVVEDNATGTGRGSRPGR